MAVVAIPPKIPIFHFRRLRYSNVNIERARNCTTVPNTNAMATDRNIPRITDSALPVLSSSETPSAPGSPHILISAITNAAPSSSKTIDTVVEVGIPSELNTSRRMMSVTITAMKIHIRS